MTVILVIGIRESARFNATMVIIKLAVVLFVIVVGSTYIDTANWHPFLPFGWAACCRDRPTCSSPTSASTPSRRTPRRRSIRSATCPIGILVSLGFCTVLYILVAAVLTGMVPYTQIDIDAPVAAGVRAPGAEGRGLLHLDSAPSSASPASCWC